MNNTTPEQRMAADIKMKTNGDIALINTQKREQKKILDMPRTKRYLKEMQYWNTEKLQKATQSSDKSAQVAAESLLKLK